MELYSVKMRASQREAGRERHISGAEKIVREERLEKVVSQLLERALHHAKGRADFVNLKVEAVSPEEVTHLEALPVTTCPVDTVEEGRDQLRKLLAQAGIDHGEAILGQMEEAYGMRGAMLLHVDTLQRLEPDPHRGIRATYMDAAQDGETGPEKNHFREALVLATKVANQNNILGELCISDDPDYVTGYFAYKELGYVRITKLKEPGDPNGGRIFLFRGSREEAEACIRYLEREKVLVHLPEEAER